MSGSSFSIPGDIPSVPAALFGFILLIHRSISSTLIGASLDG